MPGLAFFLALALAADDTAAAGPGRIEGIHRIRDPGRDRPGPDPRGGSARACIGASWAERRSSSMPSRPIELDVYPEYTGTISGEILAGKKIHERSRPPRGPGRAWRGDEPAARFQ